jgi:putative transposase
VLTCSFYKADIGLVKVRYTFRCYPTPRQEREMGKLFGCVRYVYNRALRFRTDSYAENKTRVNYNQSSAALTQWKKEPECTWLNQVSCVPLQQSLRHLQTAFRAFFEKRAAYPGFKSKRDRQSAEFTRSAFKWDGSNKNLVLSKIGRMDVHWSRDFQSEPGTVTITKDRAGRYFVSLCLDETVTPFAKTGEITGLDLGINRLATLANGEHIPNPKHSSGRTAKLARAQRVLSRRVKGSGRWNRQRLRVARLHMHIADSRKDWLDKITTGLVRRFDVLCIEDLNVRGMMQNHRLARAIGDAGMGMFRRMLEYKCAWHNRKLKVVDRYYPSSKRCSACGFVSEKMPLSIRSWTCPECGGVHDRDENAARNLLAAGHAVTAHGGRVRPPAAKAAGGNARRSVNQPALS